MGKGEGKVNNEKQKKSAQDNKKKNQIKKPRSMK